MRLHPKCISLHLLRVRTFSYNWPSITPSITTVISQQRLLINPYSQFSQITYTWFWNRELVKVHMLHLGTVFSKISFKSVNFPFCSLWLFE